MTAQEQALAAQEVAKAAGLRYVSDHDPGIRRKRYGERFRYTGVDGKPLHDAETLERIKALGIPPAWEDVWICRWPNGHIQATGRDAKGRKQYRYHPRWREVRDETKYHHTIAFGLALPAIRARVRHDLGLPGLPREKVLALVVRLLETTLIRVGNREYARHNKSYGLTTMRSRHVDISGSSIIFHFRGKSGKQHVITLRDRRLAQLVKRCQSLPGHELFQYIDEDGQRQGIESGDVNEYLREITGEDFTAKDFRTWAGTVLAAQTLQEFEAYETQTQAKKNIVNAVEQVAERLGNTPAICRSCYIHPTILEAYLDGSLITTLRQRVEQELEDSGEALSSAEQQVLEFLQERFSA